MPLSFIFNNRGFEHRTSNIKRPTRKTNDLQASRFLIPDLPSNFDEYETKVVKTVQYRYRYCTLSLVISGIPFAVDTRIPIRL